MGVIIYTSAQMPPKRNQTSKQRSGIEGGTYADDTASSTTTSIASLQTLVVATLAKIIFTSVNDDHSADNALRPNQLDVFILNCSLCNTRGIS